MKNYLNVKVILRKTDTDDIKGIIHKNLCNVESLVKKQIKIYK